MAHGAKKFKSLRTELFFIYRLLQEGYGPRYWLPYIKNRFFGNFLFRRLPRYDYVADPDSEMHIICQKKDIWMLASMLHSFFYFSKLCPKIIIHDDGSFDHDSAKLVASKFANTEVWLLKERTQKVMAIPNLSDIVRRARTEGHIFLYRPIDALALSNAKKLIFHDTDMLYYKTPTEVIDFILGRTNYDAIAQRQIGDEIEFDLGVDDFYIDKYNLKENKAALLNGGYIMIDRDKFKLEQLAEFLEHTKRPFEDYFIEMASWICLVAQVNFELLSPERYAIKGFLNDAMVMKHYTSPRRYEMFAYGIDRARQAIKTDRKKD